jgi:membrane protease YdiL (CAAX protease family)
MPEQKTRKTTPIKSILTILFGMSITLIRVVMPTHLKITPWVVILETVLEIAVCVVVILLNREFLSEAFRDKLTKKDVSGIIWGYIFALAGSIVLIDLAGANIYRAITGMSFAEEVLNKAPASAVGSEFNAVFPVGVILTMCVTAPILEEIVFRMAFKRLIKNNVLFLVVSSLCFGFIHTASFLTLGILYYFIMGCMFAGIYLKTKDIRISIGAHMLFNIMTFMPALIRWIISLF